MSRRTILRTTVVVAGVVQLVLGLGYLFAPHRFNEALGLTDLPGWAGWPFGLLGARFLALSFGMLVVYRDPLANRHWIQAMIAVQAIDWFVVLVYLANGTLELAQVATAPYLPLVLIAGLIAGYPRSPASRTAASET